jgi:mono/diheme cytochrome c family protein
MFARLFAMPALNLLRRCAALTVWLATGTGATLAAESEVRGLTLTVASGGKSDVSLAPNVWLHVPAGQPATPFVAPGKFTAAWAGTLSAELRADFTFHGEFTGHLKVTVGETVALDAEGTGDQPVQGKTVRLNKGTNQLLAEYTAPENGEAFVRLFWSNSETPYNPLPLTELRPADSAELQASQLRHQGRDLWAEARCAKCHITPGGMAELTMDAPSFNGLGTRRNPAWLAQWIEQPAVLRPSSLMPKLFHGTEAKGDSAAVAAFLASLQGPTPLAVTPGDAAVGQALFEKLHCGACHGSPDSGEAQPQQLSLQRVNAKFAPGALAAFLQRPEAHYAWIRMPNFKLTPAEAQNLAEFLSAAATKTEATSAPADAALIAQGKKLVTSSGCLNCHPLDGMKSELTAKPLVDLTADKWTAGCLADTPTDNSKAPAYAFTAAQRTALRAFAATDRTALTRHTAADFTTRQSEHLNCRACHGQHEGFPTYELLLGKLKPEWAAQFIGGTAKLKPRPWLESRMPAFPAYAQNLAAGLAQIHGFGPTSGADPKPAAAEDLVKSGHKLVGSQGGLQCISCHPVNDLGATQVFEAPGINLGYSFDRLQPSFFRRWLRAPTALQADSKMPVYFDEEGRSPLPDIEGGDGPKTIQAVWEYLRLGPQMPKPE